MFKKIGTYIIAGIICLIINFASDGSFLKDGISLDNYLIEKEDGSYFIGEKEDNNKVIISKEGTMAQSFEGGISYPTQNLRTHYRRNNPHRGGNTIAFVNDYTGHVNLSAHFFLTRKFFLLGLCEIDKYFITLNKLII